MIGACVYFYHVIIMYSYFIDTKKSVSHNGPNTRHLKIAFCYNSLMVDKSQRLVTLDRYISLFWLDISPPSTLILTAETLKLIP